MLKAFRRIGLKLSGLLTLIFLTIAFIQAHWALWYYFGLEFDAEKVLAETATGGAIGVLYGLLSPLSKRFLALKSRQIIDSTKLLVTSMAVAVAFAIVALAINKTKITHQSEI